MGTGAKTMTNAEAIRTAALSAAAINAESWIDMHADPESCADGPWSDPDDSAMNDDVHIEEIENALGRAMTAREYTKAWPVYRDALTAATAHLPRRG